jgi:two-component system, NarL family, response regulator NreC
MDETSAAVHPPEQCLGCDRASACLGASSALRRAAVDQAIALAQKTSDGQPTTVILCSEQPIMRSALRLLIDTRSGYQVVLETVLCEHAVRELAGIGADVVLIEFDLIDASSVAVARLQSLLGAAGDVPVLVLTDDPDPEACHQAYEVGVRGLVLKKKTLDDLFGAIDRIRAGESWMEGPALQRLLQNALHARKPSDDEVRISKLTKREREIVAVLARGKTNQQVSDTLGISVATVRHHLCAIFDKLGIATRGQLIVFAYRHDLADRGALESF